MRNIKKLQHLYRRAGFGLTPEQWLQKGNYTVQKAVNELFEEAEKTDKELESPESQESTLQTLSRMDEPMERENLILDKITGVFQHSVGWLGRMAATDGSPLLEKMCLFWHGHFACETKLSGRALDYTNALRTYALTDFRSLVLAVAQDAAMLHYLNNQQNKKGQPNENFARELMELFTIGRGNYTEQDVKEAARAFTGWASEPNGDFKFKRQQHDYGTKTFMGKTGNLGGEEIVDILLARRETAKFVTQKIYRFFVNETVDVEKIQLLSKIFYESNYDINKLMRSIFESDWFYDDENIGSNIKSPIELVVGMIRTLGIEFESPAALVFAQRALGQVLFRPPNVAGWAGGKAWIDNSTLLLRLNLANYLFAASELELKVKDELEAQERGKVTRKLSATLDWAPLQKAFASANRLDTQVGLTAFLLTPNVVLNKKLLTDSTANAGSNDAYFQRLTQHLMSLPEYQMC